MAAPGKITFNIITPAYFGETQLSLIVLRSYILYKDKNMDIHLNQFFCEDDTVEIASKISSQNPSAAVFSVYVWTEKKVREVCLRLKESSPNILIIIGGNVPTYQAKEYMETYPFFDIAVKGEGEETLYRVLKQLNRGKAEYLSIPNIVFRIKGKIVETKRQENFNIESQNYPLLLDKLEDSTTIFYETSRGCLYKCKYCAYNMNFEGRNVLRFYPLEKVKDDLERIFRLPVINRLDFTDSSMINNRERGLEILKLLNKLNAERVKEGKAPVEMAFDVNLEDFDDAILYEVKRLNTFAYGFGLQSTDEDVLRISQRRFIRKKFMHYFNQLTKKSGAPVNLELMFGLPGDTYEKFRKSLEFAITQLDVHFLVCFRFAVLPGSGFREEREKYHIECQEFPPYYVLSTPTFSSRDLEKAEKLSFYIQLIYTSFRGIKKFIDKNVNEKKLDIYEKTADLLSGKYEFFFQKENLRQGDVYEYALKLREPGNAGVKHSMIVDMRRLIKIYLQQGTHSTR